MHCRKEKVPAVVILTREGEQQGKYRHARYVPDDAEIAQQRHQSETPEIDEDLRHHQGDHHSKPEVPAVYGAQYRHGGIGGYTQCISNETGKIGSSADVYSGSNSYLANQVQPRATPGPLAAAQSKSPIVQTAGGRICRSYFGHRSGDTEYEDTDYRPSDRVDNRSAELQAIAVEKYRAGENRDDRKGDREV